MSLLAVVLGAVGLTERASPQESAATFRSKVNVVQVSVVVRNDRGEPVSGLTQNDFQLFDKGRRQTITSFSVLRHTTQQTSDAPLAATATDRPQTAAINNRAERHVVYLFDDLNVAFTDLPYLREAALRHFKTGVLATDRSAIYTFSGRSTLPFTSDRAKLEETVTQLRFHDAVGQHSVSPCPDVSYYLANLILNVGDTAALDAVTRQTIECAHVIRPVAEFLARSAAMHELATGEQDTQIGLRSLQNAIRMLAEMPGQRLIVLVSPGFFAHSPGGIRSTAGTLDLATRNNVVVSALDVRGIVSLGQMDAMHKRERSKVEMAYYGQSSHANDDLLEELANSTGGTFFHNNNDLKTGLARLTDVPEFTYLLGFTPTSLKTDGSFHALKVRLPEAKQFTVQARRGYYALAAESTEEARMAEMRDAVFSREERKDLPSKINLQISKQSSGDSKLTVVTKLDPKGLHFEKIDGRNCDSLTIVSALFDTDGGYVTGTSKTVNLRLRDETLAQMGDGISVPSEFQLKRGIYMVRVVVRESKGNATSAQNSAVPVP